jgi:hypothetical protein
MVMNGKARPGVERRGEAVVDGAGRTEIGADGMAVVAGIDKGCDGTAVKDWRCSIGTAGRGRDRAGEARLSARGLSWRG